jgi:hypothetical protein
MAKVRCRFCEFEVDQKCQAKKGAKVKVNKKRSCQFYKPNEEKILNFLDGRQNIGATTRPDWWWSREARRAERDRLIKNTYDCHTPEAVAKVVRDCSRKISGIKKIEVWINRYDETPS